MEGNAIPIRDGPAHVEVVAMGVLQGAKGVHANKVEPRLEDESTDNASAPESPGGPYCGSELSGPSSTLPGDAAPGDSTLAPRSSDIAGPGAIELGLLGCPSVSSPPPN
jgi:hypothetical protein